MGALGENEFRLAITVKKIQLLNKIYDLSGTGWLQSKQPIPENTEFSSSGLLHRLAWLEDN